VELAPLAETAPLANPMARWKARPSPIPCTLKAPGSFPAGLWIQPTGQERRTRPQREGESVGFVLAKDAVAG
jgi:hypothetical protein